jgi:plasmid stabilization system protein ParE
MTAEQGFKLHPGAASDITSIWEFIAKDNPLAAKVVREDILDAIRRLVPFPHQGHQRRDLTARPVRFQTVRIILSPTHPTKSASCILRARWSPKPPRDRGHPSWTEMNLRVRINSNWFARLHGTAFQNIVPIFVSCFPSFGRGFDSHRPLHKPC